MDTHLQSKNNGDDIMMRYYGYGHGMMNFGGRWIMMIGFILLIAIGVYAFYRLYRSSRNTGINPASSAQTILDERYARGEISDEMYKNMKSNLR
jgi:putative membrane protein